MKIFLKIVCALYAIVSLSVFAGIKSIAGYGGKNVMFCQYTHDEPTNTGDYRDAKNLGQFWLGAQTIKLTIAAEADVWLSNYVNSWYSPIAELDGNVFQMGAEQYGAVQLNGDKTWVGTGDTTTVTFVDDATGATNSTTAYYLGHFEGGEDISVWMTTLMEDGNEQVDMQQYVFDAEHDTTLVSRVDGTHDLAGNVRINFGVDSVSAGFIGREFVAFGVDNGTPAPSGQPLPGALVSLALALGTLVTARKIKFKC